MLHLHKELVKPASLIFTELSTQFSSPSILISMLSSHVFLFLFMSILWLYTMGIIYQEVESYTQNPCCGNIFNKNFNYDIQGSCPDPSYELVCENNKTVLNLYYGRHQLQAVAAGNSSVRSVTAGIDDNNCTSITSHSIPYNSFDGNFPQDSINSVQAWTSFEHEIIFVSCKNPASSPIFANIAAPCNSRTTESQYYSYVVGGIYTRIWEVPELCSIDMKLRVLSSRGMTCNKKCSNHDQIQREQVKGLELRWLPNRCGDWQPPADKEDCRLDHSTNLVLCRRSEYSIIMGKKKEIKRNSDE